jgi:quinol monooxygenase YgiN
MIIVTGHLTLDPADRDAFVADSVGFVRDARNTSGCLDFALSADSVDAGRVNVIERWESAETLKAFRGDGPDEGSAARIIELDVHDYEVTRA